MKPHERRQTGAYPYYTLSVWKDMPGCWVAGKKPFTSEHEARQNAKKSGKYRIVKITENNRIDLEPFTVK